MKKTKFTMEADSSVLSLTNHYLSNLENCDDIGVKNPFYITKKNGKIQKFLVAGQHGHGKEVLVWKKRFSREMVDETLLYLSNNMEKTEKIRNDYWNTVVQKHLKELWENGGIGYFKGSQYVQKIEVFKSEYVKGNFSYTSNACFEKVAKMENWRLAKRIYNLDKRHQQLLYRYGKFNTVFERLVEQKYYEEKDKRQSIFEDFALHLTIGSRQYIALMHRMKYNNVLQVYDAKTMVTVNI